MPSSNSLPVWFYWEGPRIDWIERCQATIASHAAYPRPLNWASFDALWDRDRDIDLGSLYVAHRADFIRAFLLARYGGLWVDSDCIAMRPLDEVINLLEPYSFIAHRERQGGFSNGFIGARPNSDLAHLFYERVREKLRSGTPRDWTSLGAQPLEAVLSQAPAGFFELDCNLIQPVCWSRPEQFIIIRTFDEHEQHRDDTALTYMLSNSAVQTYLREHPGANLLSEGSFFNHLLQRSEITSDPGPPDRRRSIWQRSHAAGMFGDGESVSGPGSSLVQTQAIRKRLPDLLAKLGVASMLDAPCGDHHWLSLMRLGVNYVGVDIVPDLIDRNRRAFPEREFRVADIVTDQLPRADLIFCRDALVHYDHASVLAILQNFQRSGAQWLLTTTFPSYDENHDIGVGQWRPLNLEEAPFLLPAPDLLLVERCTEGDGRYRDKSLGLWRLAELDLHSA